MADHQAVRQKPGEGDRACETVGVQGQVTSDPLPDPPTPRHVLNADVAGLSVVRCP